MLKVIATISCYTVRKHHNYNICIYVAAIIHNSRLYMYNMYIIMQIYIDTIIYYMLGQDSLHAQHPHDKDSICNALCHQYIAWLNIQFDEHNYIINNYSFAKYTVKQINLPIDFIISLLINFINLLKYSDLFLNI